MPSFRGESPPRIVQKPVLNEDNVLLIYLRANRFLADLSVADWDDELLRPDFLERYQPVLDVLTAAAQSEREGFSETLEEPSGDSWLAKDREVFLDRWLEIGLRDMRAQMRRGHPEKACQRAEEVVCLLGHFTSLMPPYAGLWRFRKLATQDRVLSREGLGQLPTSGLRSLLKRLNSAKAKMSTPYELALYHRDKNWSSYQAQSRFNPRSEKILRDFYDAVALQILQGEAHDPGALEQAWDDCEGDFWTLFFWPEEYDAVMKARRVLEMFTPDPSMETLTMYAIFEGLRFRVAAEVYRREHGDYPETLEQLIPELLPEAPADPFAPRQSLKFDGQRLWSIGQDREDQRGRISIDVIGGESIGNGLKHSRDYLLWTRPIHVATGLVSGESQ